jgi:hypothetical protein
MHAALRGLVGAAAGAVFAAAGVWLGGGGAGAVTTTPTTVVTPVAEQAEPDWVPGGGIRFESTVIRPDPIEASPESAELRYELFPLGASTGALPVVLPDAWVLRLADGSVHEATTPPPRVDVDGEPAPITGSVRFGGLPAGAASGDIVEVAVTGWRVATPVDTRFEMQGQPGSSFRLHDGTTVTLSAIIEQDSGSILDFDVASTPDVWRQVEANPFGRITTFQGDGPGWVSSSSTIGGTGLTGGSTGFQLRWSERQVPPMVRVLYTAVTWVPLETTVVIAGGDRGG